MNALLLIGFCLVCSVLAKRPDSLSSVCQYGPVRDRRGNVLRCGRRKRCPSNSRCEHGICCNIGPTSNLRCDFGEKPLPGVRCSGFAGLPCPMPSRYKCVTKPIPDSFGICCPRRPAPLKCDFGQKPLPGVTCGGFVGQQCPNPSRYKCVTYPGVPDSIGICCPKQPVGSECKIGKPLPGATCGGLLNKPCPNPTRYECVGRNIPGLFDGPGMCCPKLNPGY